MKKITDMNTEELLREQLVATRKIRDNIQFFAWVIITSFVLGILGAIITLNDF